MYFICVFDICCGIFSIENKVCNPHRKFAKILKAKKWTTLRTFNDLGSQMITLTAWWKSAAPNFRQVVPVSTCHFSQWHQLQLSLVNSLFQFICNFYCFSCILKVIIKDYWFGIYVLYIAGIHCVLHVR